MRPTRLLPALLLAACGGPATETLVDELRVVVQRTDVPEARPGETVGIDGVIADPTGGGFERLTWSCTRFGEDCGEALASGTAWSGLSVDLEPAGGSLSGSLTVSPFLADFVDEDPIPLVQVFTLACAPGVCDTIALAASDPEPDSADAEALRADLTDPFTLLERLPIEGVSLASWVLDVSTRSDADRRQHPTLGACAWTADGAEVAAEPLSVGRGGTLEATCAVDDDLTPKARLWGYGTAGGWDGQNVGPEGDGTVGPYAWFAPEEAAEAGPVDLWLVLTDPEGGLSWRGFEAAVAE